MTSMLDITFPNDLVDIIHQFSCERGHASKSFAWMITFAVMHGFEDIEDLSFTHDSKLLFDSLQLLVDEFDHSRCGIHRISFDSSQSVRLRSMAKEYGIDLVDLIILCITHVLTKYYINM